MINEDIQPRFDASGLITTVVQDSKTNTVLMVAWMNRQSFDLTMQTGKAHFWSRSRKELWLKGATSGNILSVESIWIDCDADTLLLKVKPAGPACHTGHTSCFFREIERKI